MLLRGLGEGGKVACKFLFNLHAVLNAVLIVIENNSGFLGYFILKSAAILVPHYKLTFFKSSVAVEWVTFYRLI